MYYMTYDREGQNMDYYEYIQPHPILCNTKPYYLDNVVYEVICLCFCLFILKINNTNKFLIF